jgi:PEP-CTERM motif
MRRVLTLVALLVAGNIGNAYAAVITFEDLAVAPGTITNEGDLVSGGFLFDTLADHSHRANRNADADNGSTYMGIDDVAGDNPTTFSRTGGGAFALTSIDIAEWLAGDAYARQIQVTGNLFGGGTVSALLTLDGIFDGIGPLADFQTFTFGAAWGNLSSVVLKGIGSPSFFGQDYFAIDNIGVEVVPEPGTLSLVGLGFAYLFGRRRRHRR